MIDREVILIAAAFAISVAAITFHSRRELAPTPAVAGPMVENAGPTAESLAPEPEERSLLWHRQLSTARLAAQAKPAQDIVIYFAAGTSEAHGGQQPPPIPEGAVGVLLFADDPWNDIGTTVAQAWSLDPTTLPALAVERDGGLIHAPTPVVGELSEALEKLLCEP